MCPASASPADGRLRIVFHGTRGSIPSPGPGTVRYGGNTPCVEVRSGDSARVVLDAGTGLRRFGEMLGGAADLDLFLTHFHWDHIQGLPFFRPLYHAETRLRIHGPDPRIGDLLGAQMDPPYFPIPAEELAAAVTFGTLDAEIPAGEGLRVRPLPIRHPGSAVGLRVDGPGGSIAYLPDNELGLMESETRSALMEALNGVDVLIHDAMYTEAEYAERRGWGHSTPEQAADFAAEAGVEALFLFHHDPERTDAELDVIRERMAARPAGPRVEVAAEGDEVCTRTRPPASEASDVPFSGSGNRDT